MRLGLKAADLAAIARAAEDAFPDECCGLLIGERAGEVFTVTGIVAAANVAPNPARRFEVDPRTLLAAHKGARALGLAVIGHYHSHPGGAAAPSRRDLARAFGEDEVWLIVPVTEAGAGAPRAHLFSGGAFREMEFAEAPGPAGLDRRTGNR